ncbi:hypothetical protein [Hymenobacter arizonensis]|uniref:Uncharacterized protein n=1 Tax=Hymenobacter arizonensis TaxID=1227077 RepID=A0A1I6BL51_HYMAR|nr:hypothetical protein [Hymenobacter arizonensis]SFQ81631.1 hypothetical protein SAMN04515668_4704 [Hymenobacter arizonensis]
MAEDGTAPELDADGNVTGPAKDGSYELPGGTTFEVKEGKKEVAKEEEAELADESVADAQEIMAGITADTSADEA